MPGGTGAEVLASSLHFLWKKSGDTMFGRYQLKLKNKKLLLTIIYGVVMIFLPSSIVTSQSNGLSPEAAIQRAFVEWQKIATNAELSEKDKLEQYRHVIDALFAVERLSHQFLQKIWKKLTANDRKRFQIAFETSIVHKINAAAPIDSANGPWELNTINKEITKTGATVDLKIAGKSSQQKVRVYLLKTVEGAWKITNLKIGKKSFVQHYHRFCKKQLEHYSFENLVAELGDYDYIALEDFENGEPGKFPAGWSWKKKDNKKRKPYLIRVENDNKYLEATDRGESVIIGKKIKWNLKKYRYISFRWRVHRLPDGGDERYGKTVDSAAGIYFTYKKKLGLIPKSVKFVWSSTLPVGSAMLRHGIGKPWMVVADSGADHLGEWRTYVFDAYQAYKDTFGGNPPDTPIGIGVLSDANSTHSFAYADYDDIRAVKNANADSGVKKILKAE